MPAPRFRSCFEVDIVDGSKLFLLNDEKSIVIDNPVTTSVARLIDGQRDTAQIAVELSGEVSPQRVFLEIAKLTRAGHVTTAPAPEGPAHRYLERWGESSDAFSTTVAEFHVGIVSLDDARAAEQLRVALVTAGLPQPTVVTDLAHHDLAGSVGQSDLVVVLTSDYLDPRLRDLNAKFYANSQPWMLAKYEGSEVWTGPRFDAGNSGCWECLADRLTANRQVERYVSQKLGRDLPTAFPSGVMPGADGILVGHVMSEILSVAANRGGSLAGEMSTLDLDGLTTARHTLVGRPHCTTCGDPARGTDPADVQLESLPAEHRMDGGYRVCPPEQTFARLEHHISPYFGAVTRLERSAVGEAGITYAFTAGHNFGMMRDSMDLLKTNMRGQSGGKGRTEIQAKVSGVCEAIERYCGVWTPQVREFPATFASLSGRALHPHDSLQFSASQYDGRKAWNEDPTHRLHLIPDPFDEHATINFTPARSLTTGERVMVPSGLVWFGSEDLVDHFYAVTDSNGGASGNTMEEAVLQGLCEVYERDAVALWWYNRIARPGVDLESFQDPYIDVLRDYYATMDRDIWVLDLSTDLSMPVFAAFSGRRHEVEDLMVGFGAHPDPDIALFRALTELNQFLPFVAERDADGNTVYGTNDPATLEWCRTATRASHQWVLPAPAAPVVTRTDRQRELPETIADIVNLCVTDLASAGMETLVVNQTRPDIELNVAKVIVPGMRHFWRRTAPGRLYDVPVKLGWADRPTAEADLNPIGVFF